MKTRRVWCWWLVSWLRWWTPFAVLTAVIAMLAIKSHVRPDFVAWSRTTAEWHVESVDGKVLVQWMTEVHWFPDKPSERVAPRWMSPAFAPPNESSGPLPRWPTWTNESQRNWYFRGHTGWSYVGVSYTTGMELGSVGMHSEMGRVSVPYWLMLAVTAGVTAVGIGRAVVQGWRARRRRREGCCRVCGYDLRATPERCPECGALVSGAAADL